MRTLCKINGMLLTTLTVVWAVLLQSCVYDRDIPEINEAPFTLTLTVVTVSPTATRAAHEDDTQDRGTAAENYVDVANDDLRVMLFDNDGNFLIELEDIVWQKTSTPMQDVYTMPETEIEFPNATAEDRAKLEALSGSGFYVMVLANSRNAGWNGTTFPALADIWKNGNSFNFNYRASSGGGSWTPAIDTDLIPMFGFLHTKFNLTHTGNNKGFGNVTLQRALAKIEVTDDMTIEGVSISDVSLSDYNRRGRLIPDLDVNDNWNVVGEQVDVSSLPAEPGHVDSELKFFKFPGEKKWVAYVPEMSLKAPDAEGSLSADRTHVNVKISAPEFAGFDGAVYPLHFARYEDNVTPSIPDDSWNHILRNHIYRFSVTKVGVTAELDLHVRPWELDEDETWNFTDNVTIQQMLEWQPVPGTEGQLMSFENFDPETGRVIMWIDDDKDKILTGMFAIRTPLNGQWVARLTPLDDALPNALTFVDEDGVALEPSHGDPPVCLETTGLIVSAPPAVIRIAPTNFGNEEISEYKLEFFVENLGTWTRVSLVDNYRPEGKTWDYFTIVRKNNKIQ